MLAPEDPITRVDDAQFSREIDEAEALAADVNNDTKVELSGTDAMVPSDLVHAMESSSGGIAANEALTTNQEEEHQAVNVENSVKALPGEDHMEAPTGEAPLPPKENASPIICQANDFLLKTVAYDYPVLESNHEMGSSPVVTAATTTEAVLAVVPASPMSDNSNHNITDTTGDDGKVNTNDSVNNSSDIVNKKVDDQDHPSAIIHLSGEDRTSSHDAQRIPSPREQTSPDAPLLRHADKSPRLSVSFGEDVSVPVGAATEPAPHPTRPTPHVPAGRRRPRTNWHSNTFWHTPAAERAIGLGTVGLHESDAPPPPAPSAPHTRKAEAYTRWRAQHADLFRQLREDGGAGRAARRERQSRAHAAQRRAEDEAYAAAVSRLRRRGWSVLSGGGDGAHYREVRAQREAAAAAQHEAAAAVQRAAAKGRAQVAAELAERRATEETRRRRRRDLARAEKEAAGRRRVAQRAGREETAAVARAEREEMQSFARRCREAEEAGHQQRLAALRLLAVSPNASSPDAASPHSTTALHAMGLTHSTNQTFGGTARSADWRHTFRSPLPTLPNAGDEAFRRRWLKELRATRLELAQAEVARQRLQHGAEEAREAAARENMGRAEALRGERVALQERRRQHEEEAAEQRSAVRAEVAAQQRRQRALREGQREERRAMAAVQRREMIAAEEGVKASIEVARRERQTRIARSRSPIGIRKVHEEEDTLVV